MPTYRLTAKRYFSYELNKKTFRKGCCLQQNIVCVIFSRLIVDLMWHLIGLQYHTGKCIHRFGGIYAYCRPEVVDIGVNTK